MRECETIARQTACLFCPCMEIYHPPSRTARLPSRKENLFSRRMLRRALSLSKE